MSKKVILAGFLVFGLGLGACSSTGMLPKVDYGQPHFVASNDSKEPTWVDSPGRYAKEHKDAKYFVGADSRCTLYDVCRDVAVGNALKSAAQAIRDKVHSLLEVASTDDSTLGTPDVQRAIESGTLQTAFGAIHGMSPDRFYWKKYWVQTSPDSPIVYYRNVYVLVSISNDDWKQSVYETLTKKAEKVNDPRARALLHKMEKRWLNEKESPAPTTK